MWVAILLGMILMGIVGFGYVVNRMNRFSLLRNRLGRKKARLANIGILLVVLAAVFLWGGMWNAMIVFIHLLVFWLISDGVFALIKKHRRRPFSRYYAGFTAIAVTAVYLGVGAFFAHHVFRTAYEIPVQADLGVENYRIVAFSDSHMGTTFHADKLRDYVQTINREQPDIVVIVGDFVDDDTDYEDMLHSCEALSELEAKNGVYFVFGNHDCGYSDYRGYGKTELVAALLRNQVIIMEDAVIPLEGNLVLCGRQDSQQTNRLSMEALSEKFSPENCVIVLDHEPNDYAAEAAAGADLVISGHTHGGQFFPILRAGEWFGLNDMTYGYARTGRTNFLVSSGISDWTFMFKTGCISEYVVIDLVKG